MIPGVGRILFTDEGFGIRVIEKLQELYEFPENVSVVDGGVLGLNLLGVISEADHLMWWMLSETKVKQGLFTALKEMPFQSG